MQKKYEFTGETMLIGKSNGERAVVKEIVSLINIENHDVKVGDKGGWIESDKNLSHSGSAWLSPDSFVIDDAVVNGHGYIESTTLREQAIVGNQAVIRSSTLAGRAKVHDSAKVTNSHLDGDTLIGEKSVISNCSFTNVRVERPATLDADSCTIESREPFQVCQNLTMSHCNLELHNGKVNAASILTNVHAINDSSIEFYTRTEMKRVFMEEAEIHTTDGVGQESVVRLVGDEEIVLKNGIFLLDRTMVYDNVELDGGVYNSSVIWLSESSLKGFAKIKRTQPEAVFFLKRLQMSECSKLELEAFMSKNKIYDYILSGDDKVSY